MGGVSETRRLDGAVASRLVGAPLSIGTARRAGSSGLMPFARTALRLLSVAAVVAAFVLALTGCGGRSSGSGLVHIARPPRPVFCPQTGTQQTGNGSFDARTLLGMPYANAAMTSAKHGCKSRVVMRNGQHLAVTADFRPDRVDVSVDHDIVVAVNTG
jgi:hypothetical protein